MNEMNRSCGCQQPTYVQPQTCGCQQPANACDCKPMPQMPAPGCFESCCKVMEAPIQHQPEFHHFHKVEHVIPVLVKNVHHHHTHHEYLTQQQESVESLGYDYYHQNPIAQQPIMPAQQMMPNNMVAGQQMMMPNNMVAGQQMMMPNNMVAGQQMMMPNSMVAGEQMMPNGMVTGMPFTHPDVNCDCTCTMMK